MEERERGGRGGEDTPQSGVGRSNVNQRGRIILSYPKASPVTGGGVAGRGVLEYFDLFTRSDNNNNNRVIIMSSPVQDNRDFKLHNSGGAA